MSTWDKELNLPFGSWNLVGVLAGFILVAWGIFLGQKVRREPSRCGPSFTPQAARCCASGQGLSAGKCVGLPESCPSPFVLIKSPRPGCVFQPRRVPIDGGSVTIGPTDWDAVNIVERRTLSVRAFSIDAIEVTQHRYQECIDARHCSPHAPGTEPGRPVVGVSADEARSFCEFAGGHLPTPGQWLFAASGVDGRRFPWGAHGLVCRRATYGIVSGPCANQGIFPDLAGLRTGGATPDGVLDLAGNVAEWTIDSAGRTSVHGGSFRAKTAGELKVWSTQPAEQGDDVGFRCVYENDVR